MFDGFYGDKGIEQRPPKQNGVPCILLCSEGFKNENFKEILNRINLLQPIPRLTRHLQDDKLRRCIV